MKKIVLFAVIAVMVLSIALPASVMAEKKMANMPIIGIVLGVFEAPITMVKNVANCKSFLDCINIPKHLGEGIINGGERILGTTFTPGSYERDFAVNSKAAENEIASNMVGWAGTGLVVGALGAAGNAIFSINSPEAGWTVVGAFAGAGAAVVETVVEE